MSPVQIVIFEDPQVEDLSPITEGRPAFAIGCAGYRLIDLVRELELPTALVVRSHLTGVVAADYPQPKKLSNGVPDRLAGPALLVNASLVPNISNLEHLRELIQCGQPGIVRHGGRIAAAFVAKGQTPLLAELTVDRLGRWLTNQPELLPAFHLPLFEYPHDVVRHHLKSFTENLEHRLAKGKYTSIAQGVYVGENVELGAYLSTDTRQGPIVIESGARIGPHTFLAGPLYIGANARILEHSAIKDRVALGHTTKVGGEVETSIIEPYSNKQHHGFLGHSYIGSWVNLGAGTSNSDLKNTYGEVNIDVAGHKIPTGMQFLGCMVGDYVKTAINTSIFTGKLIGSGSMLYGFVTTNVPSFVNYARTFDNQVSEIPVEVSIAGQGRMFARRGVTQRSCDIDLLRSMFQRTQHERTEARETRLVL